jgi:G3E family GTPase
MQLLLVTGHPGSGKSTLVRTAVGDGALGRAAVLVNDGEAERGDRSVSGFSLRRLANGCVCCSIQGEFVDALLDIGTRCRSGALAADRVVLETSGLADPARLVACVTSERRLRPLIDAVNIIALVEAPRGRSLLAGHVECARQVACADTLMLTKADLADQRSVAELRDELEQRNRRAAIVIADNGSIGGDAWREVLLGVGARTRSTDAADAQSALSGIETLVLRAGPVASRDTLQAWSTFLVMRHAERLLRVRGIVALQGEPRPLRASGARDAIAFSPLDGQQAVDTELVVTACDAADPTTRDSLRRALLEIAPDARLNR